MVYSEVFAPTYAHLMTATGAVGTVRVGGWQGGLVSAYEAGVNAGLDDSAEEAEQATNTLFVKVGQCAHPALVQSTLCKPRCVLRCRKLWCICIALADLL